MSQEAEWPVLVPGQLLHRARWLWGQAELSDDELAYLSTGQLPGPEGEPPGE